MDAGIVDSIRGVHVNAGDCHEYERRGLQNAAIAQESTFLASSSSSSSSSLDHPSSSCSPYQGLHLSGGLANAVNLSVPIRHTTSPIVTTSSVLAIVYKDGVLMCSDTLASYGRMSRYKDIPRYIEAGVCKDILICTSGDFSDYQTLERIIQQHSQDDALHLDGSMMTASNFASWLSRVLYFRRGKFNPYWQSACIAGINKNDEKHFYHKTNTKKGDIYLGYVDLWGTFFQEKAIATGLGRYFALTLMREKQRDDMTEAEARELLETGMRILFARDCYASNRIQFAKVTEEGITVDDPYTIDAKWDFEHYQKKTMDMSLAGCSW